MLRASGQEPLVVAGMVVQLVHKAGDIVAVLVQESTNIVGEILLTLSLL